jgi:hypothetical protein
MIAMLRITMDFLLDRTRSPIPAAGHRPRSEG